MISSVSSPATAWVSAGRGNRVSRTADWTSSPHFQGCWGRPLTNRRPRGVGASERGQARPGQRVGRLSRGEGGHAVGRGSRPERSVGITARTQTAGNTHAGAFPPASRGNGRSNRTGGAVRGQCRVVCLGWSSVPGWAVGTRRAGRADRALRLPAQQHLDLVLDQDGDGEAAVAGQLA